MARKTEKKAWRFYRSNLSTIVWDPENDKPLADFTAGYFTTNDPRVAEVLANYGYYEIPLDSTEPPLDVIINKPTRQIEGDVPIMKSSAIEKITEARMTAITKEVGAPKTVKKEPNQEAIKEVIKEASGLKRRVAK